jgi:hypothetical protein
MIVEGYSMDLYCDVQVKGAEHVKGQFDELRRTGCIKKAKAAGFIIKKGKVTCPNCREKGWRPNYESDS